MSSRFEEYGPEKLEIVPFVHDCATPAIANDSDGPEGHVVANVGEPSEGDVPTWTAADRKYRPQASGVAAVRLAVEAAQRATSDACVREAALDTRIVTLETAPSGADLAAAAGRLALDSARVFDAALPVWEPATNGDVASPDIYFIAGDVAMIPVFA